MSVLIERRISNPPAAKFTPDRLGRDFQLLNWCCYLVAVCLGAVEAWATRFTMFPDGISYMDIGDAYWRGDWHNAINAYWSPFYSWVTGLVLEVIRPSPSLEFPVVHLVNFIDYVIALTCFKLFLGTFIEQETSTEDQVGPQLALPAWAWVIVGYSVFVTSGLSLVTISFVSGDMLVAAVIYLAADIILRIRRSNPSWRSFALLGIVLGIGYLCKTVMFVMSIPFIIAAAAQQKSRARRLSSAATSLVCFFGLCAPFIIALSLAKGRPTFGDSGKINYVVNVGTTQFFVPSERDVKHPVRKLTSLPESYEYASPIAGTYPLWYDPSYWHEGIRPNYSLWRQARTILLTLAECAWILFNVRLGLVVSVAVCFLYLVSTSIRQNVSRAASYWMLWVPAAAGLLLYSLVVIEPRYVAALFCLLWISALSGVRLPDSQESRRLINGTVICLVFLTCIGVAWQTSQALNSVAVARKGIATEECGKVAEALIAAGIKPADKLAVISDWLFPSREGAYVARLVQARIVAEARPEYFWAADAKTQARVIAEFNRAGATAILTYKPFGQLNGWQRLANTDYYLFNIQSKDSSAAGQQQ